MLVYELGFEDGGAFHVDRLQKLHSVLYVVAVLTVAVVYAEYFHHFVHGGGQEDFGGLVEIEGLNDGFMFVLVQDLAYSVDLDGLRVQAGRTEIGSFTVKGFFLKEVGEVGVRTVIKEILFTLKDVFGLFFAPTEKLSLIQLFVVELLESVLII